MFNFMSPSIAELTKALSKAQGEIQHAAKDKDNPFFKSTYADLASVWDACREPLSKNGLAITQPFEISPEGGVILITMLTHSSGEYMSSRVRVIPTKNDPQGMGSAMTYMRRFTLSAMVGVAPAEKPTEADVDDDDDGNAASVNHIPKPNEIQQPIIVGGPKGVVVKPGNPFVGPMPHKGAPHEYKITFGPHKNKLITEVSQESLRKAYESCSNLISQQGSKASPLIIEFVKVCDAYLPEPEMPPEAPTDMPPLPPEPDSFDAFGSSYDGVK